MTLQNKKKLPSMQWITFNVLKRGNRQWIRIGLVALAGLITSFVLAHTAIAQQDTRSQTNSVVTGTASYRERIALPPDAVFEGTLEDVSRADAAAPVIGRVRIELSGQVPISFEISYDPIQIDSRHTYSVRGRILVRDNLMFTTDRVNPVLTRGYKTEVTLLLVRARAENGRQSSQNRKDTPASNPIGILPASFVGDLPCADCPGIRYRLDLFPDGVFFLRMNYLGRGEDAQYDDIGRWVMGSNGKRLVLHGGHEAPVLFTIHGPDRLRKLVVKGQPIESALNYELVRSPQATPLEPKLELRGMYRHMADSGLFIECLTGKKLPVVMEGDNAALEAAYVRMQRDPNEELLVNLEGRIPPRQKMEGEGTEATLVVDRFIGVWPGETCGARMTSATLEDMYWKLTRLGDQPVLIAPQQREPHLILHSKSRRIGGFGGCNRLIGGYELEDTKLTFAQVATTRMACKEGMEMETALLTALEKVRTWGIAGQHLDLFDDAGRTVARLEARALP